MRRWLALPLATLAVATSAPRLHGQTPERKPLAFEVDSVKPNTSGDTGMSIGWPRGRFSAVNVTTHQFIENAYKLEPFRVQGGPGWLTASLFDIRATIPSDAVIIQARGMPDAIRAMMQNLLAERFKFVAHWEPKPQTVYALVRARQDGLLGRNLHKSQADCGSLIADARRGIPMPTPSPCSVQWGPGRLVVGGYLMAQLADTLQKSLQQVVVDRTGLAGRYDIDLTWSPDQSADFGPSLSSALEEQLGLKLEATKGPVDVLVIDHVEKPTPD